MLYHPIKSIGSNFTSVQMSLMAMERVFSLLEEKPRVYNADNAVKINGINKDILFENVWFEYEPNRPVLKGIDVNLYLVLANRISKCYYSDILHLKDFETENSEYFASNDKIPGISLDQLYFCGFLSDTGYSGGGFNDEPCGRGYALNEYGRALRKILMANDE